MIITDDIPLGGYSPIMTVSKFADLVGVTEGVVTGWVKRDYIPTIKVGRHRLVNVALLHSKALEFKSLESSDAVYASQLEKFNQLSRNKRKVLVREYGCLEGAVRAASV